MSRQSNSQTLRDRRLYEATRRLAAPNTLPLRRPARPRKAVILPYCFGFVDGPESGALQPDSQSNKYTPKRLGVDRSTMTSHTVAEFRYNLPLSGATTSSIRGIAEPEKVEPRLGKVSPD